MLCFLVYDDTEEVPTQNVLKLVAGTWTTMHAAFVATQKPQSLRLFFVTFIKALCDMCGNSHSL